MSDVAVKRKLTYKVMGPAKRVGCYIVWEYQDNAAVNEYIAYDRGRNFVLYPNRKLIPSTVILQKQTISIHDTKRGF